MSNQFLVPRFESPPVTTGQWCDSFCHNTLLYFTGWFTPLSNSAATCNRRLHFCREIGNFLSLRCCSPQQQLQHPANIVNEP